ncbi:hypothetical protein GIY23_19445 [Allosaccharopolyspora coralli]|uniref:Uncharacterized protein n=1 Tax=Allosaccharopolyspora coralli TaxID=2665642 RepID=A0A5Q3QIW7_9PSEU|nr:hypothetical protein [Allosaccharopolyspora coralli]QGK71399.1 hypothetical protein GIY23_19445 [Allosaccharopolyspora coralli]
MTKAITVRLDDADAAASREQAERLRVRPATLARMLVHAGLSGETAAPRESQAQPALDRLARRSKQRPPAEAVSWVHEARAGFAGER